MARIRDIGGSNAVKHPGARLESDCECIDQPQTVRRRTMRLLGEITCKKLILMRLQKNQRGALDIVLSRDLAAIPSGESGTDLR